MIKEISFKKLEILLDILKEKGHARKSAPFFSNFINQLSVTPRKPSDNFKNP